MREPRGKQAGANGKGWERQGYWGPSPGLRPPSPRGRGVGFGTVAPAFGHPLPEGEGLGLGRSHRPSAALSQRERGFDTALFRGNDDFGGSSPLSWTDFDTAAFAGMTDADLQYPCIGVALCRAPGRGSCRGIPWTRLVRSVLSRAGPAFRSRGSLVRRGEGHGAQRHHIHRASRATHKAVALPGQEGRGDDQGETPSADATVHVHARGPRPAQPARRSGQSRPAGDQGLGRGHPHDEKGGSGHGR